MVYTVYVGCDRNIIWRAMVYNGMDHWKYAHGRFPINGKAW